MKKKHFNLSYIGVTGNPISVLYHKSGDQSVIFSIKNSITKYSGDQDLYSGFHKVFSSILKMLGDGYTLQKQDIFSKKTMRFSGADDFLTRKYFNHFNGREFRDIQTYVTVTKKGSSSFFQHNEKDEDRFLTKVIKMRDFMESAHLSPKTLNEFEIDILIKRYLCQNFSDENFSVRNFKVRDEHIEYGSDVLKVVSLVDVDEVNFPTSILPFSNINLGSPFPVDIVSFLYDIPGCKTIVYNQVIEIPDQRKELFKLETKRKRHNSISNAANELCADDIGNVLALVAKTKEQLVYCHYDILFFGEHEEVKNAINHTEGNLSQLGIIPSNNCYNQKELFTASFPGHTDDLKHYDKFFTTSNPAVCLLYKETSQTSENGGFKLNVTNRGGLPINIDTSELPWETGRIVNRNKFLLGPSGTGKSFLINSFVQDYLNQNTDVVLVDTGHSYKGLCKYHKGKYITYAEDSPISINPFAIGADEYNEEKREYLKALIGVLWKGADGSLSKAEDNMIGDLIVDFYTDSNSKFFERGSKKADFNAFYEFSCESIKKIAKEKQIENDIDCHNYAYVLSTFYKGGRYDKVLNAKMDDSLFDAPFVVFEIDNIKGNKTLFPIVTLVIMDLFLQKMRLKGNRKVLIIEEAWKAIASPMMAEYIQFVFKTARKFRGEAVLVTQELDDLLDNPTIKGTIIANSDTIILMDQSKFSKNFAKISEVLSLDEVEQNKIFTINQLDNKSNRGIFKEFYIKRGRIGEIFGNEVSIEQYFVFTTERREKDAVEYYETLVESYREAIRLFVADLMKSGLSKKEFCDSVLAKKNLSLAEAV